MSSKTYWEKREAEALKHYLQEEQEYQAQLRAIYQNMLDAAQKEIDAFYGRYADKEQITLAEAKRRVSKLDIAAYQRKAKRYVADKDFSKQANEEMRLYNLTMKVNRLEMLKANIGLELVAGHNEQEQFMSKILRGRTEEELQRQAGILGKTVRNNAKLAETIPNASFHGATFSERIWGNQTAQMKAELSKLLQARVDPGQKPPRTIEGFAQILHRGWQGRRSGVRCRTAHADRAGQGTDGSTAAVLPDQRLRGIYLPCKPRLLLRLRRPGRQTLQDQGHDAGQERPAHAPELPVLRQRL